LLPSAFREPGGMLMLSGKLGKGGELIPMKVNWQYLEKATIVIALITAVTSVLWFAVSVDRRIDKLESQMQILTTAPKSAGGSAPGNPILEACAELARKAAQETYVSRSYTVDLMEKLNCGRH
jgi:hypothetical protein